MPPAVAKEIHKRDRWQLSLPVYSFIYRRKREKPREAPIEQRA